MALKRITALILAIVMTIGMFPVYTSAEEGASTAPTVTNETVPVTTTEPVTVPSTVNETSAPQDNCPYCEDTTAEDGTVIHGANCNAAYVYDGTSDVGKYAELSAFSEEYGVMVSADPETDEGIPFYYDEFGADTIMRITDWYWHSGTTGLWYQVELYSGAFPESTEDYSWPATPWVLQNYTEGRVEAEDSLTFLNPCEVCGKPDCGVEHVQCSTCGKYDCTELHFFCEVCQKVDCGKSHLYCSLCGVYDCTAAHVWCGNCGGYDCGLEHEDLYIPITAPALPENPTLPEDEEVSVLDAQGQPVAELRMVAGEKTSISAWSKLEGASYRWQVCYNRERDLWVDIQGQTGQGILVSPAMFLSLMDGQSQTAIRCVVTAGGEKKISEAISVAMAEQSVVLRASAPAYGALDTDSGIMPTAGDTDNKVNLIINYTFNNNTIAANPWAATLPAGVAYSTGSTPITIPTIAGYTPVVGDGASGGAAALNGYQLSLDLSAEQLAQDFTVNIVYQPAPVTVTVLHYWQNVNDDNYTLHESKVHSLVTGTQVKDVHNAYPGFYNLQYERPFVAADGSTVIEVYYDRYYYLMKFNLDGGYGVDPIYARYGTELEVPDPTKAGYSFGGWTDKDKNGVTLPNAMPVNGGTYYADWNAQNAQYTVAYWLLNDNNKKSLIGTHIELGTSGAKVSGKDDLGAPTDRGAICGELDHTHTAGCFSCGKEEHVHHQQHSIGCYAGTLWPNGGITDEKDTAAINAANNGSTPENGTLFFIQSNNDIASGKYWPKMYIDGNYYTVTVNGSSSINKEVLDTIVDGALISTGKAEYTATKYKAKLICEKAPCGVNCAIEEHTHSSNCTVCKLHIHTAACYQNTRYMKYAQSDAGVEIKGDGSAIVNVYYEYKEYTLRFYYAASTGTGNNITYKIVGGSTYYFGRQEGVGGTADGPQLEHVPSSEWGQVDELPTLNATGLSRSYEKGSLEYNSVTYYFISFKARYGDDISGMWPCGVFNSVTRTNKDSTNSWSGTEAFVSAWNGEHHVKYSQENLNETIKGVYEKLDENLLFASKFEDEQEVSYLCFWENGANRDWSIPELYIYNIWLPCVGNQASTAPEGAVTKFEDNIWHYRASTYNTVDDSEIANQTSPALEGYSFRVKKWKPHFIADTQLSEDGTHYYGIKNGRTEYKYDIANKKVWSGSWECPGEMQVSTKDQGSDRYLLHSPDYDPDNPGEVINHTLYKEAYTVDFYYTAQTYKLSFWNHDDYLQKGGTGSQVAYREPLLKYFEGINVNGKEYEGANDLIVKPEQYPSSLQPGAYAFEGWYTSAQFLDGTKVDPATMTMPSEPLMVYAKWVPVTRRVRFFLSEASMTAGKTIPEEMKQLWEAEYSTTYPSNSPYNTKFATLTDVTNNTYLPDLSDPGVTDAGGEDYRKIHPYAGYDFMGWFYVNEAGEEAAFDPENIPVTQDLDLYAKWGSDILCPYEIYFALDTNDDGTADTGTDGKPIYVADPITGSTLAGNSRTFDAKGDTALYAAYQNGYFPNVPSHTIMLQIRDEDGETGQDLTTFTFLYHPEESVPYTVQYLKAGTDEPLAEKETFSDNTKAVVTENFKPISGYMPDAYQKTLVVVPGGTNEIIFYYTQDTQHALYQVNHYIQNLDGETWSEYSTSTITGDIGTDYSASAISITGYDFSDEYTKQYNLTEEKNPYTGVDLPDGVNFNEDTDTVSGKLNANGMQLNLYYTRQEYTYTVRYLEYGTDRVLHDEKTGEAKYNQLVSENAEEIRIDLDNDGEFEDFRLYEATQNPQTATIRDNSTVLTFYYVRCTQNLTVTKELRDGNGTDAYTPDQNLEFDFLLILHASEFHQNSYSYEIKKGENLISSGRISPEQREVDGKSYPVLSFSLKAGEKITFFDLPTAEYTVKEQDLPLGYYDTAGTNRPYTLTMDHQVDVTVTNTYEPAVLEISKIVDAVETGTNTPEVGSFRFTVVFPEGVAMESGYSYTVTNANGSWTPNADVDTANRSMTFSLQKGQTARFANLPLGTYTVTEDDYKAKGYNSYVSVNGGTEAENRTTLVELVRSGTGTAAFRNMFPVGDLQIEKTVTKEFSGTPWTGDTFTFTVERTNEGRPLIDGNQYMVYLDDVETGTAKVIAENKLLVTIAFDGSDATTLETAGAEAKHSLVIKNLPAGTYSVTENLSETQAKDYSSTPDGLSVNGLTIPATVTPKAQFTNRLVRPEGQLYLKKELVKAAGYNGNLDEDIAFRFAVELKEAPPASAQITVSRGSPPSPETTTNLTMTNGRFTVELKADEEITVSGLPIGTYRVTEATVPQYANAFARRETADSEWVKQEATSTEDGSMYTEIQVNAQATSWLKCTNTYPVNRAELILQKLVEKEYSGDTLPDETYEFTVQLHLPSADFNTYSYTVYSNDGAKVEDRTATVSAGYTFTISLKAGQYAVIDNMPVIGYTIHENVEALHYDAGYKVYLAEKPNGSSVAVDSTGTVNASGSGTSVSRTFSAGKTDVVIFTNTYKRHLTELTINKTGASKSDENQSFIFNVTSTSLTYGGNAVDLRVVITIPAGATSGSVTLTDMPLGSYTIAEEESWSWRYNGGSETITLGDQAAYEVTINNTRTNPYWLSGADANKNIFDGTP